jgi:beta-ribofuranosylaminobenzene 5'-phosphate synthase
MIADLRNCGVRGVGQSSWGPTVFAIVQDSDTAQSLMECYRYRVPSSAARISSGHLVEVDQ